MGILCAGFEIFSFVSSWTTTSVNFALERNMNLPLTDEQVSLLPLPPLSFPFPSLLSVNLSVRRLPFWETDKINELNHVKKSILILILFPETKINFFFLFYYPVGQQRVNCWFDSTSSHLFCCPDFSPIIFFLLLLFIF